MLHDAALLYAHALNKTLNMNGSIHDGHLIVQNMLNYTFQGNIFFFDSLKYVFTFKSIICKMREIKEVSLKIVQ